MKPVIHKPTLCLDFDGVLHSYKSGWQGAGVVSDPPVPGAIAFLREVVKHFTVAVHSSRSHEPGGITAMRSWLIAHSAGDPDYINQILFPSHKPSAFVTLDDRALTFDGTWPSIETLKEFKPWNKR